jgi:hypothetical protein
MVLWLLLSSFASPSPITASFDRLMASVDRPMASFSPLTASFDGLIAFPGHLMASSSPLMALLVLL